MTFHGSLWKLILIFFSASVLSLYYLVLRVPLYQKSVINKVEVLYIAGKHFKNRHLSMSFQCGLRSNTDMKILLGCLENPDYYSIFSRSVLSPNFRSIRIEMFPLLKQQFPIMKLQFIQHNLSVIGNQDINQNLVKIGIQS